MPRKIDLRDIPKENYRADFKPDPGMIPPDPSRCQCNPNILAWSPFALGPRPEPVRCEKKAQYLALELIAGKDGKRGSMSLCDDCRKLAEDIPSLMARAVIEPITGDEK